MNYAIPFTMKFKYFHQNNIQINIKYKPKIDELNSFIKVYGGTHRINLIITDFIQDVDIEILLALKETYPDYELVVCIPFYTPQVEEILTKNNIPHYYNEYVTTWDRFQGFLNLNITDLFISDSLAFDLNAISFNAKKKNIKIRCYCNTCESSWKDTPSIKTFFIRPEDLHLYQKYIDTIEFYTDKKNINVLYEIYVKDRKWFGKINEIITGYIGDEDNRFLISDFGERRLNCQKRCMKGIEPTCHMCDHVIELSKTLKEKNIIVTKELQ